MNKKKDIEELEKIILQCVRIEPTQYSTIEYQEKFNGMGFRIGSKKFFSMLQKAGYRKADDVRKETAKEIAELLKYFEYEFAPEMILEKYGIEVDE